MHQGRLMRACPLVEDLPKRSHDGLIHVSTVRVDLPKHHTQHNDTKTWEAGTQADLELRHIPVLDLGVRRVVRPRKVDALH